MNIKQTIMLSTFVALFSGVMAAHAADEASAPGKPAATGEKSDQPKQEKKKVNRHSHPVDKGVMPPSSADTNPSAPEKKDESTESKKLRHDHKKEMKGG